MNALRPNPQTGYLESPSPNLASFDSHKKVRCLELAHEMAERGEMPGVVVLCKAVGISHATFKDHLVADERFKAAWDEALDKVEEMLVSTMVCRGQTPGGYMDRITWLRAYRPGRWNPEHKLQISSDSSANKSFINAIPVIIDAEIADSPANASESTNQA